tara:strand:- start:134 stop:301 length:168 start_codon:yes stop_codon:yes gene_type:complete
MKESECSVGVICVRYKFKKFAQEPDSGVYVVLGSPIRCTTTQIAWGKKNKEENKE